MRPPKRESLKEAMQLQRLHSPVTVTVTAARAATRTMTSYRRPDATHMCSGSPEADLAQKRAKERKRNASQVFPLRYLRLAAGAPSK
mmetsp:Transcript_110580/g.246782  ORF Transcript_110580/g.246782 Transcript_110580/m.246782 type:complete len:87 (+) Transcript_110580:228-488(+)